MHTAVPPTSCFDVRGFFKYCTTFQILYHVLNTVPRFKYCSTFQILCHVSNTVPRFKYCTTFQKLYLKELPGVKPQTSEREVARDGWNSNIHQLPGAEVALGEQGPQLVPSSRPTPACPRSRQGRRPRVWTGSRCTSC